MIARFVGFSYLFLLREIQREVDSLGIKKSETGRREGVLLEFVEYSYIQRKREREKN